MNRTWLTSIAVVLVLLLAGSSFAVAQLDTVTVKAKMGVQMAKGKFSPTTDTVWVKGDFDSWGAGFKLTTYSAADSSVSGVYNFAAGTVNYKFMASSAAGWENDPNKTFTAVAGGKHTVTRWFNEDSTYPGLVTKVPVKFQVNMSVRWRQGFFRPDSGDIVGVSGDMNGWGEYVDTLKKGATDSIWSKSLSLDEGSTVTYKFTKSVRNSSDWESVANRTYVVPVGGGSVPVVFFDNDSIYRAPVTGTIKWGVNMSVFKSLGWFDPAKDKMQVRGGFEGWGGTSITQDLLNTNLYSKTLAFNGLAGDAYDYKFYINYDSVHATALYGADWATDKDSYNYEHPATTGDGNKHYLIPGSGTLSAAPDFYGQINAQGILAATDSVNVTFKVNMGPAVRYSNPLSLATDTVYLVTFDKVWRASQQRSQGLAKLPETFKMTHANATDSMYTVTIKVKGPTHYNLIYKYRVSKTDGTSYDEGGGLGGNLPYRARFINKSGGVWPASYSTPQESFQKDPPMPGEAAPYTTDVAVQSTAPGVYKLNQNYPNPFNPTTSISYVLPAQSVVTLKVFNVLGQEVATLVNATQNAGTHLVAFDASSMASGVYFYRLEAGKFTQVNKMMLLK